LHQADRTKAPPL